MEPVRHRKRAASRPGRGPAHGREDRVGRAGRAPRKLLTPPLFPSKDAALALVSVSKTFGSTRALSEANLSVLPGEIHALLGENGAGKTTLVSIAAGRLAPDSGTILRGGVSVTFGDPRAARRSGIALVPQHDLLVEAASVADNLALLDPLARFFEGVSTRHERVRALSKRAALDLGAPEELVADLPVGTRQRIEIAGALTDEPDVLILDEPTAVLSPDETAALFAALRQRADSGRAVVLITHRLAEVFAAADRLTLLARGRTVKECPVSETTAEEIGALLLGSAEGERTTREGTSDAGAGRMAPALAARGSLPSSPSKKIGASLAPGAGQAAPHLEMSRVVPAGSSAPPVSVSLAEGNLLVLLAIDGNGADTLARCIAGMHPFSGRIAVDGRVLPSSGDPGAFRAAGGRFVPADRRAEGFIPSLTLAENLALPRPPGGLFLDRPSLLRSAAERIAAFGVRASSAASLASELSGGNQQKLVLARELDTKWGAPRLLVAVHPTRGLDIAASADVHEKIEFARQSGCVVLVVSSDPEEAHVFGGTFRVVYRGGLSEALPSDTPFDVLGRRMAGLAA